MESLAKGTELDSGTVVVPGAPPGTQFVLEEALDRFPWGRRYRAQQGGVPILVTVLDPVLMARKDERRTLLLGLRDIQRVEHRNLLPIHGFGRIGNHDLVVEAAPASTTLRRFVRRKMARGIRLDGQTLFAIVAHLCNALAVLHRTAAHGFVTADTVLLGDNGRVYLGSAGFGAVLARSPGFAAAERSGLLAGVPPEQRLQPPHLGPAADLFALGAMFVEMLGCRPLKHAGERLQTLGLLGPEALVACLERATAPSVVARPPDIATFKAELSEAVAEGPVQVVALLPSGTPDRPREEPPTRRSATATREAPGYGEVLWPPPPQPYDPHVPGAWLPTDAAEAGSGGAPLPSPPPPPASWAAASSASDGTPDGEPSPASHGGFRPPQHPAAPAPPAGIRPPQRPLGLTAPSSGAWPSQQPAPSPSGIQLPRQPSIADAPSSGSWPPPHASAPSPGGIWPPQHTAAPAAPSPSGIWPPQHTAAPAAPSPAGIWPPPHTAAPAAPSPGGIWPPQHTAAPAAPSPGGIWPPQGESVPIVPPPSGAWPHAGPSAGAARGGAEPTPSTRHQSQQILAQIGHITAKIAAVADDEAAQFTQFVDGTDEHPKVTSEDEASPADETADAPPSTDAAPPPPGRLRTAGTPAANGEPPSGPPSGPRTPPAEPPLPGTERLQLARIERPATPRPSSSTRLAPPPVATPPPAPTSSSGFEPRVWLVLTGVVVAGWMLWAELIPG